LKTLEKINRKGIRNSRKIGKANSAQGSPLSPAHARAPSLPDRRAPPVSTNPSARSLSLCLAGPDCQANEPLPRVPLSSLSAPWACLVSSAPFALAVDRRVHTRARRRISRPRRPPTRPAPFLEPRQCPVHTPHLISCSFALSRALPTPPAAVGDPRPHSRPSSSPETAPSLPKLRPKVRHPTP
jgi:hypothetical protein